MIDLTVLNIGDEVELFPDRGLGEHEILGVHDGIVKEYNGEKYIQIESGFTGRKLTADIHMWKIISINGVRTQE